MDANESPSTTAEAMFSSVKLNRVPQMINDQIRALIHHGKLRPGDRLPSERELCAQFEVSRVTIRQALRILEANGLVTVRLGAHGGAFVTAPSQTRLGEGLADLLWLSPLTATEVTQARQLFEIGIVPLVVERATNDDIEALNELCVRQRAARKNESSVLAISAEFHIRVAACTHNAAIEMLVQSLHGPMLKSLNEPETEAPALGQCGNARHQEFVDAIQGRDAETAEKIMRAHLQRTADRVANI